MPSHALGVAPRRRNGRLQACNPCRRRKVACDHTLPVCTRCRKRNTPNSCVYSIQNDATPSSTRGSIASLSGAAGQAHQPGPVLMSPQVDSSETISVVETPDRPNARTSALPGYLGATSFSAVFQETQDHLLGPHSVSSTEPTTVQNTPGATDTIPTATNLDKKSLDMAINLLTLIPDEPVALEYFYGT